MASDDFQDKIKGGFMQKILLMTILIAIVLFADTTATYFWPIPGGEEVIVSNLGDFRPQSSYGSAHFHAGIDIPADTEDVWTITLSFRVDTISHNGIGLYCESATLFR
ncbi:hypothetical protein BXT86_02220 [candidate division WOR-3 bacterium 4484_100]|uniref:Uncharacterized protein n=1 Tax=candidate division WOR-3 bacterium 4484_100 TaxID=1936077 RepID=A0A1V4QFV0_UNCW3|nr:MAG: hypothetical protein BXT86_02220 [candidate division WOR-3 bacterium 4484_100]